MGQACINSDCISSRNSARSSRMSRATLSQCARITLKGQWADTTIPYLAVFIEVIVVEVRVVDDTLAGAQMRKAMVSPTNERPQPDAWNTHP